MARNNIVHELGHAFGQIWYKRGIYNESGPYVAIPKDLLNEEGWIMLDPPYSNTWRQHPNDSSGGEVFADMFLGWTFDVFMDDGVGSKRRSTMTTNMTDWIQWAANR